MRRELTSSDAASAISVATTCSIVKEDGALITAKEVDAAAAAGQKRRSVLGQKARRVLSDLGAPPTARQDAKDGKRTLNFADPGGLIGDALVRQNRV